MCHPKITNVFVLLLLFNLDKICLVICRIKWTSIITSHCGGWTSLHVCFGMNGCQKKRYILYSYTKSNIAGPNHRVSHSEDTLSRDNAIFTYIIRQPFARIDIFLAADSLLNFALLVTGAWTTNRNHNNIEFNIIWRPIRIRHVLFLEPITDAPPHRLADDLFFSTHTRHTHGPPNNEENPLFYGSTHKSWIA